MQKDDGNLQNMIREIVSQMKDDLLKSLENRIEKLETTLFEKEQENDQLNDKIKRLSKKS